MDYERIQKPHHERGLSPSRLRIMLLGLEKKRKEEEDTELPFPLGSEASEVDDRGFGTSESCKDVDIVSVTPDCSNSLMERATMETLASELTGVHRVKDYALENSKVRPQDDCSASYDSGIDCTSLQSFPFEFQKADRALPQRVPYSSFSKAAPSKWDDAEKWIASPISNRPKTNVPRKAGLPSFGHRQPPMKVVVEVPEQKVVALDEINTKRIDPSHNKDIGVQKSVDWVYESCRMVDLHVKPSLESSVVNSEAVSLSQHDSFGSIHSATTFIPLPSTVRSVSMRDMGTEMTPIASQEASRTGTPARETPLRSPSSSRPSTPGRTAPTQSPIGRSDCQAEPSKNDLSEKELKMQARREIKVLGTQLGKMNIAAWASKEEEDHDSSNSLKAVYVDKQPKCVIETRASSWEEAEKAKYMARYKHEEIKIQAWENHQKAKTEAEMRKVEVEVERMRSHAQEKLMNKLATARHKAEEKRAAAEAKWNKQAVRTEQQAEYVRRTGRIPTTFSCWNCCS